MKEKKKKFENYLIFFGGVVLGIMFGMALMIKFFI